MFDDVKYEVHPQINNAISQATDAPQEPVEQEAPAQQEQKQQEPSIHEVNYRALREKERRLERERDDAIKIAQELQQRYQKPPIEEGEELSIGNDDIVEGKHLTKVQKEIKKLKEELNQYKQQSTVHTTEARLKAQYPDFDRVVTRDNIEILKQAYPELVATFQSSSDMYNIGVSAYTLIKKFNIDQNAPYEAEQAQKNVAKPKPSNSISPQQGDTPLNRANAFANGLTDELKQQMLKEMNEYRKGY